MFLDQPYLSNQELNFELSEYGESSFENIPDWLQSELKIRNLGWEIRKPTPIEIEEAEDDGFNHRVSHNELTTTDYINKYKHGKEF